MMVDIAHLLNRSVTIHRQVLTPDGQGGHSYVLSPVGTVRARRHAASGRDRIAAGKEETEMDTVWYFDRGVVVKPRDVLILPDGRKDEVVVDLPPSVEDFVKVGAKEIQVGAVA